MTASHAAKNAQNRPAALQQCGAFLFARICAKSKKKNDYKAMRIIDDETYAQIVAILAQDPKVALFQKLLLSQKAEPAADKPGEIEVNNEGE